MKIMADLYLGLVHYPIYNKRMKVIATAVTNFDIHDIARTARTYDVKKYFLIHPLKVQEEIIKKITGYWQHGFGRVYNPDRSEALDRVQYLPDIASAVAEIKKLTGKEPVPLPQMPAFTPIPLPIKPHGRCFMKVTGRCWYFLERALVWKKKPWRHLITFWSRFTARATITTCVCAALLQLFWTGWQAKHGGKNKL